MLRIAHIAAHVGGGVGSVLRELFVRLAAKGIDNILCCLDSCESNFNDFPCAVSTYQMLAFDKQETFLHELNRADIVLLHYWNHPLTAQFLMSGKLPPCRLLIWSHNSGLYEPHIIPSYLSALAKKIVFTSQCSLAVPNISSLSSVASCDLRVIHSTRSLDSFLSIGESKNHYQPCRSLLYVGTVSKAKMHPLTPEIFAALSRKGYNVRVVGGPNQKLLAEEVSALGGRIDAVGPVLDVLPYLREADIFIYPLRGDHYGTGEQVILEAMAAGLPVVAFANPAEKAIVQDCVTGLLVSSESEFIRAVNELCNGGLQRDVISKNALSRLRNKFSSQFMADQFIRIFYESMSLLKTPITHPCLIANYESVSVLGAYALHSFFDEEIFNTIHKNQNEGVEVVYSKIKSTLTCKEDAFKWIDGSKSTPFHCLRYFPDDIDMLRIAGLIEAYCSGFALK